MCKCVVIYGEMDWENNWDSSLSGIALVGKRDYEEVESNSYLEVWEFHTNLHLNFF